MRKIFVAAILLTALVGGNVSADDSGATAAPPDINHADSVYYAHRDFYNMTSTADRIILTNYPTFQQTNGYACGPASALTVLQFFGNNDFDEATLSKRMKTAPNKGTSLGNMVKFFKSIGWNVRSSLDTPPVADVFEFQKFVAKTLTQGTPIIVENVEWGGHWRVIIGLDTMSTENLYDDVLIFADPFDTSDHKQDGYAVGSLDRFFYMWFDHNVLPKKERNQPWIIATPRSSHQ